jgi:5-methylcytosine-specific restriction endonuclease McrA
MAKALNRYVLTVNRGMTPMNAVTCKDAMGDLCNGKALVVDMRIMEDGPSYEVFSLDEWIVRGSGKYNIRTEKFVIPVPEVILMETNHVPSSKQNRETWKKRVVKERDEYRCNYCGAELPPRKLTIDHIYPKSKGGGNTYANTTAACTTCNGLKSNKLLSEIPDMHLIKEPGLPTHSVITKVPPSKKCESWEYFFK